ncbi:hypothetical protein LINGRAHAP2_LOCUS14254 [Linum grandiflorum]
MLILLCGSTRKTMLDTIARIDQFISVELSNPIIDPIGYVMTTKIYVTWSLWKRKLFVILHGRWEMQQLFPKSLCYGNQFRRA